jgi:hypothetical protein
MLEAEAKILYTPFVFALEGTSLSGESITAETGTYSVVPLGHRPPTVYFHRYKWYRHFGDGPQYDGDAAVYGKIVGRRILSIP